MSTSTDSSDLLAQQTRSVAQWAERAAAAGWLDADEVATLVGISGSTSSDLFAEQTGEPLVVALFGGTGVGKSSLLNRLVGEAVATVGVIRPTSLEATVYVHQAVEFAGPAQAGFQRAVHTDDARRNVVWVDMPDVDSTAQHNRELVLGFLPFVDVLVYVVSPERYRDEAPWSLLRAHADNSAWVFVMNQIDRGQPAQIEDLRKALDNAGFSEPVLYPTSCGAPSELDEFEQLASFIDSLAEERIRAALHEEGRQARLRQIGTQVTQVTSDWPDNPAEFASYWASRRATLEDELRSDLVERLAPVAARMADGEAAAPGELWDDWASDRVGDALSATRLDAREAGWSAQAVLGLDEVVDEGLAPRSEAALRESVRASLARPGNALQRALHSACSWLIYALPLLTLAWIGCCCWLFLPVFPGCLDGWLNRPPARPPCLACDAVWIQCCKMLTPARKPKLMQALPCCGRCSLNGISC